jgi:hypothetical protein
MEILQIDRTQSTPKVVFDPEEFFLQIKGASRPENAKKFYRPLVDMLDQFINNHPVTATPLSVEIKLTYFNSASMIYLTDIFKLIANLNKKGMKVLIDWYIDSDDDVIREAGLELSDMTGLHFNFIED